MTISTGLKTVVAAWVFWAATVACAQPNAADDNAQPILRLDANGPVSEVTALAFSPDGKTLFAAGWDKLVYVWAKDNEGQWNFVRGRALRIPIGPGTSGVINAMSVSEDGKYLAVAGNAVGSHIAGFREGGLVWPSSAQSVEQRKQLGTIYVFHLAENEPTVTQLSGHIGPVLALAFAPSQEEAPPVLVSAGEDYDDANARQRGAVRVWNLNQPEQPIAERLDLPAPTEMDKQRNLPRSLAPLRTGKDPKSLLVGIAWADDVFRVWDVARNRLADPPNGGSIACASVNNQMLLAGGWRAGNNGQGEWQLGLWKPPITQNSRPTRTQSPFTGDALPLGLAIAAGDQRTALAISMEPHPDPSRQKIGFFLADTQTLNRTTRDVEFGGGGKWPAYAISPQGDFVAVAGNLASGIQIYRANQLQQPNPPVAQVLKGVGEVLPRVRFYRKGEFLGLALNRDLQTPKEGRPDLIFDLEQGETLTEVADWQPAPGSGKAGFSVTPGEEDGRKTVAIRFDDGRSSVITLPEDQTPTGYARCPKTENHPPLVALMITSPGFADPMLNIYNAETGDRLRWLVGHTGPITNIAFSDDGKLLASASQDRTVRVWWMEDLDKIIGTRGLLKELNLSDKGETAVVQKIGDKAQAAIRDNLNVDDIVEGVLKQDGELAPTPKAKDFYAFLSTKEPGEKVTLQIRRGDQNLRPEVIVEQAVDERKPLFTLFFHQDQAEKWSWLGWTPTGPFDSSDQNIEQFVGWHFNTKIDNQPATFARINEYRKQNHGKGLLKNLIEAGEVPLDWPPIPDPEMSLYLREGQDPLLPLDTERRVRIRSKDVKAILDLPGFPADKIDTQKLIWQIDGGPAQSLEPHESAGGSWVADLSGFDWNRKPNLAPHRLRVSLTTKAQVPKQYFSEQEIIFHPEAPPPEPARSAENPLSRTELPTPTITTPAANTVFYEGQDEQQTEVVVELTPGKAQALAGRMTFQVNGETVQRSGQDVVKTFDGSAVRIKETLPLEAGENRIRVRLRSNNGQQVMFSETVVAHYRRPPQVLALKAVPDQKNPFATVSCVVQTPEDLPLKALTFAVNDRIVSIAEDQIEQKQRDTDKTLWDIQANKVLLDEGQNVIRALPKNADGPVLRPRQAMANWQPPPAPLPPRPTVDFSNVSSQEPITRYREGQEFPIRFKVQAEAKLAQVEVYLNGERLEAPEIPQPENSVKYQFEIPVKLNFSRNEFKVIAVDENLRWNTNTVTLNVIQPPVTLVVDRLEVPKAASGQGRVLTPILSDNHTVTFDSAAGHAEVVLHGRVVTATAMTFERPYVKCWVNGFLKKTRAYPVKNNPKEWEFATRLVLNQAESNRLLLELPEAAESESSQTRCLVDCEQPETKQRLNLVVIGHDSERGINRDVLKKQAEQAFGIQDNKSPAFETAQTYVVGDAVRTSDINYILGRIKHANPNPERGDHEVLMFYYQGQEVLDKKNQLALATKDRALPGGALTEYLNELAGAHLLFLDVAQPNQLDKDWETGPFLGLLRSVHGGERPAGQTFPLMSALQEALPKVQELGDLPGEVQKTLTELQIKPHVPDDLKRLIIGAKKPPGKVAAAR